MTLLTARETLSAFMANCDNTDLSSQSSLKFGTAIAHPCVFVYLPAMLPPNTESLPANICGDRTRRKKGVLRRAANTCYPETHYRCWHISVCAKRKGTSKPGNSPALPQLTQIRDQQNQLRHYWKLLQTSK